MALVAALFPAAAAAQASSSGAQASPSITNATTGLSDAGSVAPVAACAPATPVRATCLAQVLSVRATRAFVHPRLRRPSSIYRFTHSRARRSHASTPAATPAIAAAGAPQPGTPAYLQQAYDLAWLSGTAGFGETIAIVDAFDDPNAESDLAVYRAEFGLPPCTSANGCFTKYDQSGNTGASATYPGTVDPHWELEISLDLDAVSALCPNCNIDLVEANSDQTPDLGAAQTAAGGLPGVSAISDSWDVPLSGYQAYKFTRSGDYTFPWITTVAASGDVGYPGSGVNNFPAALSGVTAAGGTTLQPASASGSPSVRGFTESAWSGAGSGCDQWQPEPSWQSALGLGCNGRSYSDISADGDPNTGMQVYDSDDDGWVVVGGTSESAPLIAAYYALVGATAEGASWAYSNASLLNDPTDGSNGTCSASISYICNGSPGYDGPTGIGSISGAAVTGAPGIAGPGTNGSYSQLVTAKSAQLRGGIYPNGQDTTYWWEYGTTTSYGQEASASNNDIGGGTAPVPVNDTLSGLAPGTTYHYRLDAQNQSGTEYGYDYTFTTPDTASSSNPGGTPTTTTAYTQSPPTTTTSNPPVTPPSGTTPTSPVTAPAVTNVHIAPAATSATVSATIATGGASTTYILEYGSTPSLGQGYLSSQSSRASASAQWTVRSLSPGKIYYLRVVASNAGGSAAAAVIRFKTSPVTISRISKSGSFLYVVLRCHGSATCRLRLQGRAATRVLFSKPATIRGNRTTTVTLRLTKSMRTLATRSKSARVFVLSTWSGSTATVSAAI